MTINNINSIGSSQSFTPSNKRGEPVPNQTFDYFITHNNGKNYNPNGNLNEEMPENYTNGSITIDTGNGDDQVIINDPINGPVNVDTGSGDDRVVIGPSPAPPEPRPVAPIAANETGKIEGDPHFYGADGGKYDVQGKPGTNYSLLSDQGLELRGRFDAWGEKGATAVGETGLTVGEGIDSDFVNFRKDGSASINGQRMEEGKLYELADGGTAKLENGELTVTTAEGYTIKQSTHDSENGPYINIEVGTGENGVDNGRMPSGLLGQTFDADSEARNGATGHGAQGEGAIVGDVGDYERPALDPINDHRGAESAQQDAYNGQMNRPTNINTGNGNDAVFINSGTSGGFDVFNSQADKANALGSGGLEDLFNSITAKGSPPASAVQQLGEHFNALLGDGELSERLTGLAQRLDSDNALPQMLGRFLENSDNGQSLGRLLGKMLSGGNTETAMADFLDQITGAQGQGKSLIDQLGGGEQRESLIELLQNVIGDQDLPEPLLDFLGNNNPQAALGELLGKLTGNQEQGSVIGQLLSAEDPQAALRNLSEDALNDLLGDSKISDAFRQIISADDPRQALSRLSGEMVQELFGDNEFATTLGQILTADDPGAALADISAEQLGRLTGNEEVGKALQQIFAAEDPSEALRNISTEVLGRALGDSEMADALKSIINAEDPEAALRSLSTEMVDKLIGDNLVGEGLGRLINGEDPKAVMADISGKIVDKYINIPQVGPIGGVVTDLMNGKDPGETLGRFAGDLIGKQIGVPGVGAIASGVVQILQGEDPEDALMSTAAGYLMTVAPPYGAIAGIALTVLQDPEAFGQMLEGAWDNISGFFENAWEDIGDTAQDIFNDVADAAEDVVEGVTDTVNDIVEGAGDVVEDVVDGAKDVVEDVVDGAKDFLGSIF